jgi:AcrR family transcriptional regulator
MVAEETKERLISSAIRLFSKHGVDGTSIPLLAEAAGVGTGTIYRHFASKEALVNEVFRAAKLRLKGAIEDDLDLEQAPRAVFDDVWERLIRFAEVDATSFHFLELQDHGPHLDAHSRAVEMSVLAPIALTVARFQSASVLRDDVSVDVIIATIWGALTGLVKAARNGYMQLTAEKCDAARDACWRAYAKENK